MLIIFVREISKSLVKSVVSLNFLLKFTIRNPRDNAKGRYISASRIDVKNVMRTKRSFVHCYGAVAAELNEKMHYDTCVYADRMWFRVYGRSRAVHFEDSINRK